MGGGGDFPPAEKGIDFSHLVPQSVYLHPTVVMELGKKGDALYVSLKGEKLIKIGCTIGFLKIGCTVGFLKIGCTVGFLKVPFLMITDDMI